MTTKTLEQLLADKQRIADIKQERKEGLVHPFKLDVQPRHNGPQSYNYKVKKTGLTAQAIIYEQPILTGYTRKHTPQRGENRTMANEQNIKRARKNVYDLVNTNFTPFTKMLTLTYGETQLDYDRLYLDFKHFKQALKRLGYDFPYLAITEHQTKRGKKEGNEGSLHIHALLFTDTYIPFKDIKKAWGDRGSVHIEKIDKADNKGAYVAKYITKEGAPADKKSYRTSRNIKRPTYSIGLGSELDVISALGNEYQFVNSSEYSVVRGHNSETGEIYEDIVAEVLDYKKG